jgi:hypothetical protein
MADGRLFHEVQYFRHTAGVVIYALVSLVFWSIVAIPRLFTGRGGEVLFFLIAFAIQCAVFYRFRLEVDVSSPLGIDVFSSSRRRFQASPSEIRGARQVRLSNYQRFAGVRFDSFPSSRTPVYTAFRSDGVEVTLSRDRSIVIGSQRPDELVRAIGSLIAPKPPKDDKWQSIFEAEDVQTPGEASPSEVNEWGSIFDEPATAEKTVRSADI